MLKSFTLFIVCILFTGLLTIPSYGAKYAVIIGINDYINLTSEDGDLAACEHDAKAVKEVLTGKYGFDGKNIKVLLSKQATKKNIKKAFFDVLVDKCKPGDVAVFYYSGHGTQFDDTNGDEADGIDEGICPADMDDRSLNNYIVDDEFAQWISKVKTENFTIVFDSCFSGTATRGFDKIKGKKGLPKSRFYRNKICKNVPKGKDEDRTFEKGSGQKYTFLSACSQDQVSWEDTFCYDGDESTSFQAGVFTVNFTYNLSNSTPGVTTYEEILNTTISDIKSLGYEQDPQIEGNYKRALFNTPSGNDNPEPTPVPEENVPKKSYVLVTGVSGKNVDLGSGSSSKIKTGTIFEVYPPGETEFAGSGTGKIEITSVSPLFAKAVVIEGSVKKNGRAVEISEPCGNETLNLYIDDPDVSKALYSALTSTGYIAITDTPQFSDRILFGSISSGKLEVGLYTRDGRELVNTAGDVKKVVNDLRYYLDNAYFIKQLTKLSNPNPDFRINLWTDRGANPSYAIGDTVNFNFKSNEDCYLTLIDISADGKVTVLFPNKFNSDNKIKAGREYSIPSKDMGFKIKVTPPAGTEMVKAIATKDPLDLSGITAENTKDGFRSMPGDKGGSDFIKNIPSLLTKALNKDIKKKDKEIKKKGKDREMLPLKGWSSSELIITIK